MSILSTIVESIGNSAAHEGAIYLLRNVPGLPPIVQTVHILSVAAVMASMVFIALRSLNLAFRTQDLLEMRQRLLPWTLWALPLLFVSGGMFVLARPRRFILDPVMSWKMLFMLTALLFSYFMLRQIKRTVAGDSWMPSLSLKLLATGALTFWILTVLAGRWVYYSEYIFARA